MGAPQLAVKAGRSPTSGGCDARGRRTGTNAQTFGDKYARLAREVADHSAVERMGECDHGVAAFDQVELDLDHLVDGIAPEQTEHDHRHGEGDADDSKRAAQGRPAKLRIVRTRRGVSTLADSNP